MDKTREHKQEDMEHYNKKREDQIVESKAKPKELELDHKQIHTPFESQELSSNNY